MPTEAGARGRGRHVRRRRGARFRLVMLAIVVVVVVLAGALVARHLAAGRPAPPGHAPSARVASHGVTAAPSSARAPHR